MKIIHYYTGAQVSNDELSRARAVRLDGHLYQFRDVRAWDGLTEHCDKIVSDNDAIVAAYDKKGVGLFSMASFFDPRVDEQILEDTKPRRGRPKKEPKSEAD